MTKKKYITPHTTIEELFTDFPEIKDSFFKFFPDYAKINNPALQSIMFKNTTIEQLCSKTGRNLPDTINTLRSFLGLEKINNINDEPDWLDKSKISKTLDARPIIMSGGHPIQDVTMAVQSLSEGEVFQLVTPFQPTPLIEMIGSQGFKTYCEKENDILYYTYFSK